MQRRSLTFGFGFCFLVCLVHCFVWGVCLFGGWLGFTCSFLSFFWCSHGQRNRYDRFLASVTSYCSKPVKCGRFCPENTISRVCNRSRNANKLAMNLFLYNMSLALTNNAILVSLPPAGIYLPTYDCQGELYMLRTKLKETQTNKKH